MLRIEPIEEYPYSGEFYTKAITGGYGSEKEEESVFWTTKCDIQQSNHNTVSGVIKVGFNVYFPMIGKIPSSLKRGVYFRGDADGLIVNGMVESVRPSQLKGCSVYISDTDV
jgi:hypothetical protein